MKIKRERLGVYVDFDNVWGGILRFLSIDPKKREKKYKVSGLTLSEKKCFQDILENVLPQLFYKYIANHFSLYEKDVGNAKLKLGEVRYVKAFSTFSKLPFHNIVGNVPAMLHKYGIEPFNSFLAKDEKDASDRALILEVIEDVFFNKVPVDHVVIVGGDIDFYPLFSFFYEHSDKDIYIASFRNSLSQDYFRIPLTNGKVIVLDDLPLSPFEDSKTVKDLFKEKYMQLKIEERNRYDEFKKHLIQKYKEALSQGKKLRTGFFIKEGKFNTMEINIFIEQMKNEKMIEIHPDNERETPLNGEIVLKDSYK